MATASLLISLFNSLLLLLFYGIWGLVLDSIFYNIPLNFTKSVYGIMYIFHVIKNPLLNNTYVSLSGIGALFCTMLISNINNIERYEHKNIPKLIRMFMFLISCINFYMTSLYIEKEFHSSFTGNSVHMFFPIILRIFPVWLYTKYLLSRLDTLRD